MKSLTLILLSFLILISCEKALKLEKEHYFVFGTYNGYCQVNCTLLFKIQNGEVLADDMSTFVPGQELRFENVPLSDEKYTLAYDAFEELPDGLLQTMDESFGCPGCVDQDIIYLKYFDGADTFEWLVDTEEEALPEFLKVYANTILSIVLELEK